MDHIIFFRPEKEGFVLIRMALPHLRLLTLPSCDPISLLAKYLTKEEKTYLAGQLLFKDDNFSGPAPASLNTTTTPRLDGASLNLNILKLIPENLVTDGHLRMEIDKMLFVDFKKFVFETDIHHDCILKGVEILTRAIKATVETSEKKSKRYYFKKIVYNL